VSDDTIGSALLVDNALKLEANGGWHRSAISGSDALATSWLTLVTGRSSQLPLNDWPRNVCFCDCKLHLEQPEDSGSVSNAPY
jgi:hypothetical protein